MTSRKFVKPALVFIAVTVASFCLWLRLRTPRADTAGPRSAAVAIAVRAPDRTRRGAVSGAIRSSAEAAIAGARVCATSTISEAFRVAKTTCAESNDGGNYAIEGLLPGAYVVTAHADGYLPASARDGRPVVIEEGALVADIDLELEQGGARVTGYVVDVTGGPVPGAEIEVTFGAVTAQTIMITSAADGSFVLSTPPGAIALNAMASGYATARVSHVAPSSDLVIEMVPGSAIRGVVVTADGKPVPSVEVRAIPVRGFDSAANPAGVSNAEGEFSIEALETGEYGLRAEGDGWLGQSEEPIALGIAQSIKDAKVIVRPAAQLQGSVVSTHDDEPCRQGTVTIGPRGVAVSPYDPPAAVPDGARSGPPVPHAMAPIEADGSVHFRGIVPGPYHVVVQCDSQLLVGGPSNIDVPQSGLQGVNWKVAPGLGLNVHVVDDANQPVPGAPFRLSWPDRGAGRPRIVMPLTTDATGRYETPQVLYPGTYTLDPETGYEADSTSVDLRDGVGRVEVTFHMKGRGSILVTVRTSDSNPVDAVRVNAKDETDEKGRFRSAVPLGNGRFQIGPLASGAYDVEVADDLNPPAHARVVVSNGREAQATIVLDRRATIRGRVVDARNQPAPDVWVNADCMQRDQPATDARHSWISLIPKAKRVVSDLEGRFVVSGVSKLTTCRLRAEEPHGSASALTRVRPGEDVVLSLQSTGALSGTAQTADGQPVDRFTFMLRYPETGQTRSEPATVRFGGWKLEKVAPGKIEIQGYDDSGEVARLQVDLAPGQMLDDIRLIFQSRAAAILSQTQ